MSLRTSFIAAFGATALLAAFGTACAALAEPAAADCPRLQQVQTDLVPLLNDLESRFAAVDTTTAHGPDDQDRQAIGEVMQSMADMLEEASGDVASEAYRHNLAEFSAFFGRGARITLGDETAPAEEVRQFKQQGAALGSKVDDDYLQACGRSSSG